MIQLKEAENTAGSLAPWLPWLPGQEAELGLDLLYEDLAYQSRIESAQVMGSILLL